MKRLEIKLFVDINEEQTNIKDVICHLEGDIDTDIEGIVKRVDIIDEIEVA